MGKPDKVSLSEIKLFNPRRLPTRRCNQRTQTESLSLEDEPSVLRHIRVGVCVCAGEPVRGGPSAEAEGGVVRSDP